MRAIFFSRRLIFYGDIFYFGWLWYGLGGVIVELAHKSTTGKADRGCSKEQTQKERQQKIFFFIVTIKHQSDLKTSTAKRPQNLKNNATNTIIFTYNNVTHCFGAAHPAHTA